MENLKLTVCGTSCIKRRAERAVMTIKVFCKGVSHYAVRLSCTTATQQVHALFRNSLSTEDQAKNSPATHIKETKILTGTYTPWQGQNQLAPVYTYMSLLEAEFLDFTALDSAATAISNIPLVSVTSISWDLFPVTWALIKNQAHADAVKRAHTKAMCYAQTAGRPNRLCAIELKDDAAEPSVTWDESRGNETTSRRAAIELALLPEEVTIKAQVTMVFVSEEKCF